MDQMPLSGEVIGGEYRLHNVIGVGGMATIFDATHMKSGLQVAIKFLRPEHSVGEQNIKRLQFEAEAASAVGHQSIVSIYNTGTTERGVHYIVMELLEGESLSDRITRDGQLDFTTSVYLGCQMLSALAAVHGTGIIHRDLKVSNIFLCKSDKEVPDVKLIDFGLSRVGEPETFGQEDAQLTRKGYTVGTPAYMSPEQANGEADLDERSDIYSVGVILYRCMTGSAPFVADTTQGILYKVTTEPPIPVQQLNPQVPGDLVRIIDRALAKDRNARYQSAPEMFDELIVLAGRETKRYIDYPRNEVERTSAVAGVSEFELLQGRGIPANVAQQVEASSPAMAQQQMAPMNAPAQHASPPAATGQKKKGISMTTIAVIALVGIILVCAVISGLILLKPFG